MKKFNRIIALTTALILSISTIAFATVEEDIKELDEQFKQEVDYIDDVYKYDLSLTKQEEKEEEVKVEVEVLNYGKAVGIINALGLIKKNSLGFFREDEVLSVEDFLSIANTLTGYSHNYESAKFVTHDMALDLVMTALGYDFIPSDAKRMEKVYRLNILKGIKYNPEKYISRGEMAQLLYNVLTTEVVELVDASSNRQNYGTTEDATLLKQVYGYEIVEGLVTGANGIDIYANRTVPENTIEIDRVSYLYDDVKTNNLFGHKVYGLVDTREDNKLVFAEIDASEEFVTVSFNDIVEAGSTIAWENEEGKGSVNTSSINHIVYNGVTKVDNSVLNVIETGEGTISFAKTTKGKFDVAIINEYDTYKVNRYSARDEKLYFEDGRKYNGYDYIDASDDGYEFINVIIEGKPADITDIGANHMVSIFDNGSNFIQIEATSATVEGKISEMYDGDTVVINEKTYGISPDYQNAIDSGAKFAPITLGMEATFRLNTIGNICYVGETEEQYKYAVITKIGTVDSAFESSICVRMFNQNGDWVESFLDKKVTIDGKQYTDQKAIEDYVAGLGKTIFGTIIRYKLNSDGKVTFLDTKNKTSDESGDINTLREDFTWENGNIEWNKGLTLNGTKYKLKEGATLFFVPEELDDEEGYSIIEQKSLTSGTKATLILYNSDEYFRSNIGIYSGKPSATFNDTQFFLVTTVRKGINEQGREILILKGLDSAGGGSTPMFTEKTYKTTASIAKNFSNIKSGDIIRRAFDGNGDINATEILFSGETDAKNPEYFDALATANKWDNVWGTMVKVSPSDGMALISAVGETYSFTARIVAVYDFKTKTGENIALSDIKPGDKAFLFGNWGSDSLVIYRNIPTE